jgi:hypothetical protein
LRSDPNKTRTKTEQKLKGKMLVQQHHDKSTTKAQQKHNKNPEKFPQSWKLSINRNSVE